MLSDNRLNYWPKFSFYALGDKINYKASEGIIHAAQCRSDGTWSGLPDETDTKQTHDSTLALGRTEEEHAEPTSVDLVPSSTVNQELPGTPTTLDRAIIELTSQHAVHEDSALAPVLESSSAARCITSTCLSLPNVTASYANQTKSTPAAAAVTDTKSLPVFAIIVFSILIALVCVTIFIAVIWYVIRRKRKPSVGNNSIPVIELPTLDEAYRYPTQHDSESDAVYEAIPDSNLDDNLKQKTVHPYTASTVNESTEDDGYVTAIA